MLANGQWLCSVTGKVTAGLASHGSCVTDSMAQWPAEGDFDYLLSRFYSRNTVNSRQAYAPTPSASTFFSYRPLHTAVVFGTTAVYRTSPRHLESALHFSDFETSVLRTAGTVGCRRQAGAVYTGVGRRISEVTRRRARLLLGWVTAFGRVYHLGM